jgi:hypothetical protein
MSENPMIVFSGERRSCDNAAITASAAGEASVQSSVSKGDAACNPQFLLPIVFLFSVCHPRTHVHSFPP